MSVALRDDFAVALCSDGSLAGWGVNYQGQLASDSFSWTPEPVANAVIRYNLSVNDRYGGYHYGFENATGLSNAQIYNNTHYYGKGARPEIIGPLLERTPMESVFSNNIFYAEEPGGTMGANAENGANVVYDTNVYYNITPPASEKNARMEDPVFAAPGDEPHDVDMENGREVLSGYRLSPRTPYRQGGKVIKDNGGLDFWGGTVPRGYAGFGAGAPASNQKQD